MASAVSPEPSEAVCLQPMMCTRQLTPATPTPLLPTAPIVPALTSHTLKSVAAPFLASLPHNIARLPLLRPKTAKVSPLHVPPRTQRKDTAFREMT
jgi:hypothetical protein